MSGSPTESLSTYLGCIEQLKAEESARGNNSDFLFRGQNEDNALIPRLARLHPKGGLLNVERLMMKEFERLLPPLAEFEPRDAWDILALAQHHGLPTRLLDWSYSALAALWFCVRHPPRSSEDGEVKNGVVWILKSSPVDFLNPTGKESPYTSGQTRILRPRVVARRIQAQTGLFTCHKHTKAGVFVPLERNTNFNRRLVNIPIAGAKFGLFREGLMSVGVSSFTLFPDLDGLAAHLERRYFHDADPNL